MVFMKMPVGLNAVGDGVTRGKGMDRFFKDTDLNGWVKGEKIPWWMLRSLQRGWRKSGETCATGV